MEQPVRRGNLHQVEDFSPAAGLAEDGYIIRVAAKTGDIVPHPFQGRHQVRVACVGGVLVLLPIGGQIQIAQDIQPVVQGDHHHVPEPGQVLPVISHLLNGGACREPAAMKPHHHRFFGRRVQGLAPYVQILAVFVLGPVAVGNHNLTHGGLWVKHGGDVAIGEGVPDALPGLGGPGSLEAVRVCVLDTMEGVGAVHTEAPELSGFGLDNRLGLGA